MLGYRQMPLAYKSLPTRKTRNEEVLMNIKRAEDFCRFLSALPPEAITMHIIFRSNHCGAVGCWVGWAYEHSKEEIPIENSETKSEYAARIFDMPLLDVKSIYYGDWTANALCEITKTELLAFWRKSIVIAKMLQQYDPKAKTSLKNPVADLEELGV